MFEPVDGRRRLVHSVGWLCAAAASLALSLPVGAQLEIVLEPRTSIVESAVTSDGAIWLQTETPIGPSNRRYSLVRVSPDLDSYSARELPDSFRPGIASFRDGVLASSSEPGAPGSSSRLHLHWIGPEPDAAIPSWYTWSDSLGADTLKDFVAPASDGSAVYVISRELGAQLSQLGVNGEEQWRQFLGEQRVYGIVATLDGVVALSAPSTSGYTLTAFSRTGDEVWRTDAALGRAGLGDVWFVPPRTLALLHPRESAESPRLMFFDTADRSVRTLSIPVMANRVRPVFGGLLYVGRAMGTFLASVGDDAEIRWTRRPNFDDGIPSGTTRYLVDVQSIAPNQIVVVTARRTADERTAVELIRTSLETPELAALRCAETNVLPLLEREQMIPREFGIRVRLLRNFIVRAATPRRSALPAQPIDADGCDLPTESNYFGFLSDLATELERRDFERPERFVVQIDVDVLELPYRMDEYHVNWDVRDAPATSVHYVASASAAPELAEHLTETVLPHFERMLAAASEFRELTGCRLTVEQHADERPAADADRFYADTEEAVGHVLAEARRIASELNQAASASRFCALRVNSRGFGRYRELKPLSEAAETLREVAAAPDNR